MLETWLTEYPSLDTADPEVLREALVRNLNVRRINFPLGKEGFRAIWNHAELSSLTLTYAFSGAQLEFESPGGDPFLRQQFALQETAKIAVGQTERIVTLANSFVIAPNESVFANFPAGFEHLILRIQPAALLKKLSCLLGYEIDSLPDFTGDEENDLQGLRRLVLYFAREVNSSRDKLPAAILQEIEQSIITAFLLSNKHSQTERLLRDANSVAPWQVRIVEEYVEENWDEAITIEKLCALTGASARAIFYSFRKTRGYSPMQFVKTVRLRRARQMLAGWQPRAATVTEIAAACCFSNFGHFAREYKSRFGELPSETLRRARGSART